jgi:hypothetical protein
LLGQEKPRILKPRFALPVFGDPGLAGSFAGWLGAGGATVGWSAQCILERDILALGWLAQHIRILAFVTIPI